MLKFNVRFEGENTVEFKTGRSSLWRASEASGRIPETPVKGSMSDYMWGYQAAKQAGMLGELGVPEGTDPMRAIEMLGDSYDLYITRDGVDGPLAPSPAE